MRRPPDDDGERAYRRLLRILLPAGTLDEAEDEIVGLFRDARERARLRGAWPVAFWARVVGDALVLAVLERVDGRSEPRRTGGGGMERLTKDLRYAVRQLTRRPGFAAVLVLTLALGIGATTAVFSVVHTVLLRPLPFPDQEELVVAWTQFLTVDLLEFPASPPEYLEYRDQSHALEHLAAFVSSARTITGEGEPERVQVAVATWQLFPVLGMEPALGRVFTKDEDVAGAEPVAVISHGLWRSRFGADPGILGRSVLLDGAPRTVVGVMPPAFRFPAPETQVWIPLALDPANPGGRGNHYLSMVGRLRDGTTLDAASSELGDLMESWAADPSNTHRWIPDGHPAYLRSLREQTVGDVTRPLWIVLGAVVVVLLIACANVANLLLVRGESRAREMSVRTAMGAGRGRIVSQLLTESVVTALVGGLAGLGLAWAGVQALRAVAPPDLPRLEEIGVHPPVLLFSLAVTLAAGLLFGLAPAVQAGRSDVQASLRDEGRGGTSGRRRLQIRQLLVVSQTAMAVMLLVAAGLLLQSFRNLHAVDPGFRPEQVLRLSVNVPASAYPEPTDVAGFYQRLVDRLEAVPGVSAAGAVRQAPLTGSLPPNDLAIENHVPVEGGPPLNADVQVVTPGYFEAMGISLLRGRSFDVRDEEQAPLVAVVSEDLAERFWPEGALGGGIRLSGAEQFARVVGVVRDVRQEGLDRDTRGTVYFTHAQGARTSFLARAMTVTLRTAVDPLSVVGAARGEIQALDPDVPLYQVGTMEQAVADSTATHRFTLLLQLVFAGVALLLAAVGIYGVMAFTVARRTSEIGIRMALGAERGQVLRMVVRQGMAVVAVALAVGVAGALALGQVLSSLLFGVSPRDPATYAVVVGVLLGVALLACWIPARRASGVDPGTALRYE